MNPKNALSVLSGQSRRRGHSITAMRRNDLLIGFEAPARFARQRDVSCSAASGSPLPQQTRSNSRPTRAVRASYHENALHRCFRFRGTVDFNGDFFESSRCSTIELLGIEGTFDVIKCLF